MKKTLLSSLLLRHRAEESAAGLPRLMAAAEKAVGTLHAGDHRQRRAGSGERFWQFRDYDTGDRPQDIDWRQSAKGDHVYVREKERQNAQSVFFWLQADQGMGIRTGKAQMNKHDSGAVLCLALALLLTRAGERVAPLANPARAGRGDTALQNLGQALIAEPEDIPPGPTLPDMLRVPPKASLVLAGDFMVQPEDFRQSLTPLAAQAPHGIILQVLDPAEIDLPFPGRVIFSPFGMGREVPVTNVPSIRKVYAERLKGHIAAIRKIAHDNGYAHVLHITRDDPRMALNEAWLALSAAGQQNRGRG